MIFQQILPLALLTISNGVKSTNSKSIEQSGEHTFTWNWENWFWWVVNEIYNVLQRNFLVPGRLAHKRWSPYPKYASFTLPNLTLPDLIKNKIRIFFKFFRQVHGCLNKRRKRAVKPPFFMIRKVMFHHCFLLQGFQT